MIPMLFRVRKLDARFSGSEFFTHMVEYQKLGLTRVTRAALFLEHREWCWETFGPSCELDLIPETVSSQEFGMPAWAWQTEHGLFRLYFNEKQLAWFQLKWIEDR